MKTRFLTFLITVNNTQTSQGGGVFALKLWGGQGVRSMLRVVSLIILLAPALMLGADFYVSPKGKPSGTGSQAAPFATLADALEAVRKHGQARGCTIWLNNGVYPITTPLTLGPDLSGTPDAPFTLAAVNPGKATVTAAATISPAQFKTMSDPSRTVFLQAAAATKVRAAALAKTPAGNYMRVAQNKAQVISAGSLLPLASWPNRGYAHIATIQNKGVIWAEGRTKGENPTSSFGQPIGGEFTFREKAQGNWMAEVAAQLGRPQAVGYFAADWYFESHPIAWVKGGTLKLIDSSRYGLGSTEALPRRVRVEGLLSELDEPGEWFWDSEKETLYIWPIAPGEPVLISANICLLQLRGASDILIRDMVFEGARAAVVIEGGQRNIVAGCVVRNLSGTGLEIKGGKQHRIQSCDISDVDIPISVSGTDLKKSRAAAVPPEKLLAPDGFVVHNNHIWQCRNTRGCRMAGTGWRFTHNLIHDLPGGALNWSGNDNLIAMNEFYGVMTMLGDWGVIYTGASWWTHGNVIKNNFTHNIINLPQGHGIAGFYFDDFEQGDTTTGNVFYKVGNRAVLMNGGAAQTVVNNVFIDCFIDIYTTGGMAQSTKALREKYENGTLKRGDKSDYWGRNVEVVGKDGWKNPPWTKYPKFRQAMELDPYSPVLCTIARNYDVGTTKDRIVLKAVPEGMLEPEPMLPLQREDFVNTKVLNFAFKPGFKLAAGFEPIPFAEIGLVKDKCRPSPPIKDIYRFAAAQKNADYTSYDSKAKYDPEKDNERLFPPPDYLKDKSN
jgi:hypothetical protein